MILTGRNRSEKDVLIEHFTTGGKAEDLSPKMREIWDRIDVAHNLMRVHKLSVAVKMLQNHFKEISQATAYRYCSLAQEVWGAMPMMNKEYWRALMFEGAQADYEFAKFRKDVRGMNMARKNMIDILQLNRPDDKEIDPSMVQQHNNVIIIMGGSDSAAKALSLKDFERLPKDEKQRVIDNVYKAMTPDTIDFIEDGADSE